jgi:AcrR family transcriptional regulator
MDQSRREAVLEAALRLFTERGFEATSVPQVAASAGVGVGTIYRYFASKEALVNELFRFWKRRLFAALRAAVDPAAETEANFFALWGALVAFQQAHPIAFDFLEMHHHWPYLDEASRQLVGQVDAFLAEFVANGIAAGALRDLPAPVLTALVFGSFVGLVKAAMGGAFELTAQTLAAAGQSCWDAIRRH